MNHLCTDEITCPHCDHEHSDSSELLWDNVDHGEMECEKCEKTFKWEAEYSVTYSTSIK